MAGRWEKLVVLVEELEVIYASQLLAFSPGKEQAAGVWETCLAPGWPQLREFPPETGLILRCARKPGNPFQTKQGNRLSCRDQEGRRGSDEVVPGQRRKGPAVSGENPMRQKL